MTIDVRSAGRLANGQAVTVVEMTNSLSTQLLSNLALAIEHEFIHDEIPAPGAEPNDQKFSVVLRVSF